MMTDFSCSRCGASSADRHPEDVWHINVTMPGIGVVDLCVECLESLAAWCGKMKAAR